jgi:hypothetical protein
LARSSVRLTPQTMSPSGRSRSDWMRRNTTPEPASTGSTSMPVSFWKASNTKRLRLESFDV